MGKKYYVGARIEYIIINVIMLSLFILMLIAVTINIDSTLLILIAALGISGGIAWFVFNMMCVYRNYTALNGILTDGVITDIVCKAKGRHILKYSVIVTYTNNENQKFSSIIPIHRYEKDALIRGGRVSIFVGKNYACLPY